MSSDAKVLEFGIQAILRRWCPARACRFEPCLSHKSSWWRRPYRRSREKKSRLEARHWNDTRPVGAGCLLSSLALSKGEQSRCQEGEVCATRLLLNYTRIVQW